MRTSAMTEKFPKDPNAAGPQPGTELRPDPHAPKVPVVVKQIQAAMRLVSVIANTLKHGEKWGNDETYRASYSEVENILNTFIDSARTIMGAEK